MVVSTKSQVVQYLGSLTEYRSMVFFLVQVDFKMAPA